MKCKCKYFLRDSEGHLVCSVCGKPANGYVGKIVDKSLTEHEDKAPLYVSDKDKAAGEA